MSGPNQIVCGRIADSPIVSPGSEARACKKCEAPVWYSPTTKQVVAEMGREFEFVCLPCWTESAPALSLAFFVRPAAQPAQPPLGGGRYA